MIRRILLLLHLVPLSEHRILQQENGQLRRDYSKALRDYQSVEQQLWQRYQMRLKNDLHMSLSYFYTEHTKRVSLGTAPPSEAAENWPYYPKAEFLLEPPRFAPERK